MTYQIGGWDDEAQAYVVRDATAEEAAEFDAAAASAAANAPTRLEAAGKAAIQKLLDSTAQAHEYDSIASCISYIGDAVTKWSDEGVNAKAWRSACWAKGQQIMNDTKAGNWPTAGAGQTPTPDDVVAAMPPANWPA